MPLFLFYFSSQHANVVVRAGMGGAPARVHRRSGDDNGQKWGPGTRLQANLFVEKC